MCNLMSTKMETHPATFQLKSETAGNSGTLCSVHPSRISQPETPKVNTTLNSGFIVTLLLISFTSHMSPHWQCIFSFDGS